MHLLYTAPSRLLLIAALAVSLTLAGCDIFDDPDSDPREIATATVLVSSQGNFSDANGIVTAYDPEDGTATTAIDPRAVIQSIDLLQDRLFMMAGDRVDVYDVQTFEQVGQISDVNARYIVFVTTNLALVTTIFPSSVVLVDLTTDEVVDTAELDGSPAGMAVAQNLVFVAQGGFGSSEAIATVRPNTQTNELTIEEPIEAGCAVTFLFTLDDNEISGLCNTSEGEGQYIVIDVNAGEVIAREDLGGRVATGAGQDGFLARDIPAVFAVLDEDRIVQLNPRTGEVEAEIGPLAGNPIGGVSYDEVDNLLYVARPDDDPSFTVTGEVSIHELDGTEVGRFDAGIAPSHIVFSRVIE